MSFYWFTYSPNARGFIMFDTYEEAADATVTREQAKREIAKHDGDMPTVDGNGKVHPNAWGAFIVDHGDRAEYQGKTVLDFLGY